TTEALRRWVRQTERDRGARPVIGLFKTEVIQRKGPWRHLEAVEFATLHWVDWFNTRRLLEPIGYVPPAEYEGQYYEQQRQPATNDAALPVAADMPPTSEPGFGKVIAGRIPEAAPAGDRRSWGIL